PHHPGEERNGGFRNVATPHADQRIGAERRVFVRAGHDQPIIRQSNSATSAGLASPSMSTVHSVFTRIRLCPCRSAETIESRPRTRAPALTGAMKRTLSKP